MKRCALILACLLGGLQMGFAQTATAPAPETLPEELQQLAQAQHLRFRALLITTAGNQLSTLRLDPDQIRSESQPRTLTVQEDRWTLLSSDIPVLGVGALNAQLREGGHPLARIAQGYRIQRLQADQVDGRPTQALRFDPVDRWRYGTTLWVDRASGLVVKSEVRGTDGQPLAQAMLAELEVLLDDVPAARAAQATPQPVDPAPADSTAAAAGDWRVQGLPEGFSVVQVARHHEGTQLVVSDGLAAVSVFVEPLAPGQSSQQGQQQRGLLATQAEVRGDYQLVAIGAVPPATLQRILNGVRPERP